NGEDNRDGANDNHSSNYGAEGATEDAGIIEVRERQKRNFLMTLLCSQGVPMLCGGDEVGRSQRGNNNAYAQDNDVSWYNCTLDDLNGVGEPIRDETFLLLLNPHHEPIKFYMPRVQGTAWELVMDSSCPATEGKPIVAAGEPYDLTPRSTVLMRELRD